MTLELLSPAKNLEFGREAINHGADAVYIGAPNFGARTAATNSIRDIEELVEYAHLYGSKVFATVNTLLFDSEIDDAVKMIHQLYNAGVDALIIQDMGLLRCDLPPIELHASTQCHNDTAEKVLFLEQAGFKRVILARETSLEQMREIRKSSHVELEAFIHGSLCVSYSGQCYMSQYLNGRSGNRGCCSQPCRSTYDLYADDKLLIKKKHLLSLRDLNASQHIRNMIDAGITSFKIEGRLKDITYVKNITAFYRQLIDSMINERCDKEEILQKSSSGSCSYSFTPDPERTFNRGYTDYFLLDRQSMASFTTQKSIGKKVGSITSIGRNTLTISGNEPFSNGDGLCFLDTENSMQGFLVNAVQGRTVTPNHMPDIQVGSVIYRNRDQAFEKTLLGKSAVRKIAVKLTFEVCPQGFRLKIDDEDGVSVVQSISANYLESDNPSRNTNGIVAQLSKLGNTPFIATQITDTTAGQYFVTMGILNDLRRKGVERLKEARIIYFHSKDSILHDQNKTIPTSTLDYKSNIINNKAEDFYKKHGVREIEPGIEKTESYEAKALMTTKYCLRYELGCCLCGKNKTKPQISLPQTATLRLRNNDNLFKLEFDCQQCLMRVYKEQPR